MFLNSKERNLSLLSKNKLLFTSFYIEQRKHYKIILKKKKLLLVINGHLIQKIDNPYVRGIIIF